MKKEKKIKKKLGDRYDGRRVRHSDPTNVIVPFLMKTRNDAQVEFDAEIDVSKIEERIHERRKNGENVSFMDYFFTALIRTFAEYPRLNRFVAGRRLFARDDLEMSIVVKKEMNIDTETTPIKIKFAKDSSVYDVEKLLQEIIQSNKGGSGIKNDTDKFMSIINLLPRFLFSFVINTLTLMDFYGIMPKFIHRISPFHTSIFVTNMGSVGSGPIYHHIYNWGTTSIFVAMGTKKKLRVIDKEGKLADKKIMTLRFVADERIGDGFYLSKALKYFTGLFLRPELLEQKAERVLEDDQI